MMIHQGNNKGRNEIIIRRWLSLLAVMILILVGIGGFTRLSKAGLSITEWKPITGIIPPMSEKKWQEEFEKFKKIAQWRLIFKDITLDEFKKIYLIEYFHRIWGRIVGLAVIVPAVFMWLRSYIRGMWKIYTLFLSFLILAQGVIGWLMVRTGVEEERAFVDPVYLALHHVFALFVYSIILFGIWKADKDLSDKNDEREIEESRTGGRKIDRQFAREKNFVREGKLERAGDLLKEKRWFRPLNRKTRPFLLLAILLLLVQFFSGSLVAGQKSALIAPTYPDMNGKIIPEGLITSPKDILYGMLFSNFFHRHFSLILGVSILLLWRVNRKIFLVSFVFWCTQFLLGVLTLINSRGWIPVELGLAHQLNAWLLFSFLFLCLLRTF